jgi:hypothetical protein
MSSDEIMKKLQEPFPPEEIEWRVGSTNKDKTSGLALAYVTNRAIQNRLDDVFGPLNWQNQYKEWKNNSQICGISVRVGTTEEWVTKWDGADDSQTEAIKGGLSDSMKRAAVQWGIGRYLYKLDQQWCKIKPVGNSYALAETPRLPGWALPEGYTPPKTPNSVTNINTPPTTLKPATDEIKFNCANCKKEIKDTVHDYSIKRYKKPLCIDCQKTAQQGA